MDSGYRFHVGIDWGSESHQVRALRADGSDVGERVVEHSGAGIAAFVDWLLQVCDAPPEQIAIAIESPRGAVVETLVERGFHVYAINPKQLDRFRDRHTVAGAKDDRRDAYVLADSLRTDLAAFHRVKLDEPMIIRLRELSRVDDELKKDRGRLVNQVRDLLQRYYPQVLRLCPAADERWVWGLLELAPAPAAGAHLRLVQVKRLLREHRIRRLTPEEVITELRKPALRVASGAAEAAAEHIALLLPRLKLVDDQRRACQRRMENLLDSLGVQPAPEGDTREHRDVEIVRSLPGAGTIVAAAMLAEASQPLAERDYHVLRARTGVAPVTRQTGKRKHGRQGKQPLVLMRRACNPRLRQAVYYLAEKSIQKDEACRSYYAILRHRGHTHARALRSVADRLLRILFAALRTGTLYDPRRFVHDCASEAAA